MEFLIVQRGEKQFVFNHHLDNVVIAPRASKMENGDSDDDTMDVEEKALLGRRPKLKVVFNRKPEKLVRFVL